MSMIPFPRLHFFSLLGVDGKTCEQEVPDSSLLFSIVKYGHLAPDAPATKFTPRHFVVGSNGPINTVIHPGAGIATAVSCIPVISGICKMALEAGQDCYDEEEWTGVK